MSARGAPAIVLMLVLIGCGHRREFPPPSPTPITESVIDADHRLYEQVRTGAYQVSSAQDDLQTARDLATELSTRAGGTASHGFADLLSKLNAAGQKLGDFADDPPPFEEFKTELAKEDDHRLDTIRAANDALGDIADAQDIVENLLAGAPGAAKPRVQKIQDSLDEAVDALETGITEMGGKVEDDTTVSPGSAGVAAGA